MEYSINTNNWNFCIRESIHFSLFFENMNKTTVPVFFISYFLLLRFLITDWRVFFFKKNLSLLEEYVFFFLSLQNVLEIL